MRTLEQLTFDNTYARLPETFRQRVNPTSVPAPYLVAFNSAAAQLIDLDFAQAQTSAFVEYFSGNKLLPGSEPVAMKYAGHQFGHYVPQLGDGRAILLGEVRNLRGDKWDLHLKGAGPTAFSRMGDGRAVLRSSIREYLCCEAMHALNIPTTRALCVIGTDLGIRREELETGALVVRMAASHVRFGSFEVFAHRQQTAEVKILADYVIEHYYPQLATLDNKYVAFLGEVVARTAQLVAKWQAVGFAHGVLNTDNMSILGLTLDYGPYGFVEDFEPHYICNHSDDSGRYAFDQQPQIGYWNLACLAQALLSLMTVEEAKGVLNQYPEIFNTHIHELMFAKLGLHETREGDRELWGDLVTALAAEKCDYTLFFRKLADLSVVAESNELREWLNRYRERLRAEKLSATERAAQMNKVNPKYILRNYLAQIAIEKAERKDFAEVDRLRGVLARPFDEQPEMSHYAQTAPSWGKHLVISCSS